MATIMKDASYMGFPLSIKRGNPAPVDTTAVWYAKADLEAYASSGATAYVGQVLTLVEGGKCEAYMISNEAGTLIKLASTTASGDLASDVATLQTQVADLVSKVGQDGDAPTGLFATIEEVRELANSKLASIGAEDGTINVLGTATAPTLKVAISADEDNALSLASDGLKVVVPEVVHPEYTIAKSATASSGAVASYELQKDGVKVGVSIDIPKDLVVSGGSVVELEAGKLPAGITEPGTYLKLILANSDTPIYIPVGSLIEYVTGGSAENDAIQINVTSDTHKVSASVKAGSLTKAMLVSEVQASLDKADSAIQEIASGSADGTISVDGGDVAVKGLKSGAFETVDNLNATAKGYADAVETKLAGQESDLSSAGTIAGAKKYADEVAGTAKSEAIADAKAKIDALDVEDSAKTGEFVTSVSQVDGKISVARKALVASDIPELAQSKIAGLTDALDAKQDNLAFMTAYDSTTNKVATATDIANAKSAVVGGTSDTKDNDTVIGAKRYADDVKATLVGNSESDTASSATIAGAKKYADAVASGAQGGLKGSESDASTEITIYGTRKFAEEKANKALEDAKTDASTKIADAKSAILGEAGYAHTVKDAYDLADSKIDGAGVDAKIEANNTTVNASIKEAKDLAQSAKDTADAKVASVGATANKGIEIGGTATAPTVGIKLDPDASNIASLSSAGLMVTAPAVAEYAIAKLTAGEGFSASYQLQKDGVGVGEKINIPKDMVVESGTVETKEAGDWGPAGTYLHLVLANAEGQDIYINVSDLIEYVTSGSSTGDMVVLSIDDDHKITASITDGTITKAKLATAVQTSLGKADSALQPADVAGYDDILTKTEASTTYVAKETDKRLMTDAEGTKLGGIAEGAQVNVIESIKVNGVAQTITEKAVNITVPKTYTATNPVMTATGGRASWTINTGITTTTQIVKLYEIGSGEEVLADVQINAVNGNVIVKMNASADVSEGTYRAVVIGF